MQLFRLPSPVGKDQNVRILFQISRIWFWCQRLPVPPHTCAIISYIDCTDSVQTGTLRSDMNVQSQPVPLLLPTVPSHRYVAFLQLVFVLLAARPARHIEFSKTFALHSKIKTRNSIADLHTIQQHNFENPPTVHRRHVLFVCSVLASPKNASAPSPRF